MMPVHPLHRNPTETLREDRETVILADQLGYHDAFIGEHLTDQAENITSSLLFLATLIHATKNIKLASGTCNLSQIHPVIVAANAAMFDHLAEGRFILGVSPGALVSDAEAIGILEEDRNKMFAEAIDVILAIWQGQPPYDIEFPGNRFKVTTRTTMDLAYGVGVILVAGVVNAVRNMPQIYIDNARMLGASRWRVYTTVVLPSIFPELRATILLSLGIGWAAVLGAEYLGAQSGLGYIIIYAEQFAYLDRMFLVALIFILYASVSYWLFARLSAKMLQWMPRAGRMTALG